MFNFFFFFGLVHFWVFQIFCIENVLPSYPVPPSVASLWDPARSKWVVMNESGRPITFICAQVARPPGMPFEPHLESSGVLCTYGFCLTASGSFSSHLSPCICLCGLLTHYLQLHGAFPSKSPAPSYRHQGLPRGNLKLLQGLRDGK